MMNRHVIEAHLKFSYNNHSEKVVNSILELHLHCNCISKRDFWFFKIAQNEIHVKITHLQEHIQCVCSPAGIYISLGSLAMVMKTI